MKRRFTAVGLVVAASVCWAHFFDAPPTKPTFPLQTAMDQATVVISNEAFRCKSATWAGINLNNNPTPNKGGLWRLTFTDGTHGRMIEVNSDGSMRVPSPYRDRTILPEMSAMEAYQSLTDYIGDQTNIFLYVLWTYGEHWNARMWNMEKNQYFFLHVIEGQVLTEGQMRDRLKEQIIPNIKQLSMCRGANRRSVLDRKK